MFYRSDPTFSIYSRQIIIILVFILILEKNVIVLSTYSSYSTK